jgi:hypothetical protein
MVLVSDATKRDPTSVLRGRFVSLLLTLSARVSSWASFLAEQEGRAAADRRRACVRLSDVLFIDYGDPRGATGGRLPHLHMHWRIPMQPQQAWYATEGADFARWSMRALRDYWLTQWPLPKQEVPAESRPLLSLESRRGAASRCLLREEELIAAARALGINIHPFSAGRLETRELAHLMRRTAVFIGAYGAGLANLILLRPNSLVVEMLPWRSNEALVSVFYKYAGEQLGLGWERWFSAKPPGLADEQLNGTIDPARSVNRPQDQIYLATNLSFHPIIFADNAANAEQSWLLQQGLLT